MTTPGRPTDHDDRMERGYRSLEGLSVGDAFGERSNYRTEVGRHIPPSPWYHSDDTETALSIAEVLERLAPVGR